MKWVGYGTISLSVTLRLVCAHLVAECPEHLSRGEEVKAGV